MQSKLAQFHILKSNPDDPKHFNDSLMGSQAFRNPHLYARLVEFVDVDERASNISPAEDGLEHIPSDWYADAICTQCSLFSLHVTHEAPQRRNNGNAKSRNRQACLHLLENAVASTSHPQQARRLSPGIRRSLLQRPQKIETKTGTAPPRSGTILTSVVQVVVSSRIVVNPRRAGNLVCVQLAIHNCILFTFTLSV